MLKAEIEAENAQLKATIAELEAQSGDRQVVDWGHRTLAWGTGSGITIEGFYRDNLGYNVVVTMPDGRLTATKIARPEQMQAVANRLRNKAESELQE